MTFYCIDCKHYDEADGVKYAKCKASAEPGFGRDDLVSPELDRRIELLFCSTMRNESQKCGPDAKLFIAKDLK